MHYEKLVQFIKISSPVFFKMRIRDFRFPQSPLQVTLWNLICKAYTHRVPFG